jgi:hypothetical protein
MSSPSDSSSSAARGLEAQSVGSPSTGSESGVGATSAKSRWPWLNSRLAGEFGVGFNGPIGNDLPDITWGYNLSAGAGLHLTKRLSLLGEFQFIGDKIPGRLMTIKGATLANTRIVSITLNPVVDLFPRRATSIYLTGGGGFYHKVTNFTSNNDADTGASSGLANTFSSNQGGANLGFGLEHRFFGVKSADRSAIFAETRYLFVNTPPTSAANGLGTTGLIPVTVGLRW